MSRRHTRPRGATAAVLAATLALGGCGGGSGAGEGASDASSSPSAETDGPQADAALTVDPSDPGEDLLDGITTGVVMKGASEKLEWRFPESYDASTAQQASSEDDDGAKYDLSIGFKPGVEAQAEGEALRDQADAGQEVTIGEVEVADKTIVTTATDSESGSLRTYFWSPDGADGTYAVLFYAYGAKAADTSAERLDEVYQTVGSLTLDDGAAS